jgi:hypothetical protein
LPMSVRSRLRSLALISRDRLAMAVFLSSTVKLLSFWRF